MAKVKLNNEDELLAGQGATPVEDLEETTKSADLTEKEKSSRMADEVRTTSGTKRVKIQIVEPVDCIIAGIPYQLSKDKSYEVPSDVAAILVNAKKVYRI